MSIQFASAQASQFNLDKNTSNLLNVQDILAKKVHVGDTDNAYNVFGKGDPILLISGSGVVMDAWDPTILRDLSSNHTVIIFDNCGVGNTTTGTKPFSIIQFVLFSHAYSNQRKYNESFIDLIKRHYRKSILQAI